MSETHLVRRAPGQHIITWNETDQENPLLGSQRVETSPSSVLIEQPVESEWWIEIGTEAMTVGNRWLVQASVEVPPGARLRLLEVNRADAGSVFLGSGPATLELATRDPDVYDLVQGERYYEKDPSVLNEVRVHVRLAVPAPADADADEGTSALRRELASGSTPLVRTDQGDDRAWSRLVDLVVPDPQSVTDEYLPHVTAVDPQTTPSGTWPPDVHDVLDDARVYGYLLLADARTMEEVRSGSEVTVLYVDLSIAGDRDAELFGSFRGRVFRCSIDQVPSIEANLSISNLDFGDFADHVDPDGVYRGSSMS